MLLLATAAFGNEVSRPHARLPRREAARPLADRRCRSCWRRSLVGGVPVAVSGLSRSRSSSSGDMRGAPRDRGVGLLAGAAAYAAIFTWAGLATRHALVARARLRLRLGGRARRVPRRDPLPQRAPLHARARPRRSTPSGSRPSTSPSAPVRASSGSRSSSPVSPYSPCGGCGAWTCPSRSSYTPGVRPALLSTVALSGLALLAGAASPAPTRPVSRRRRTRSAPSAGSRRPCARRSEPVTS